MTHRIAILGASGYTGAELVRLIATHPSMRIVALTGDRKAGMAIRTESGSIDLGFRISVTGDVPPFRVVVEHEPRGCRGSLHGPAHLRGSHRADEHGAVAGSEQTAGDGATYLVKAADNGGDESDHADALAI